jgi:predicted ribosomally synthesized peptide with nif11-like leader
MSEEQLSALLAKLKEDTALLEKIKAAADIDGVVALAKEAGFEINRADWSKHEAIEILELSEQDLEAVVGGANGTYETQCGAACKKSNVIGCQTQVIGCQTRKGWTC